MSGASEILASVIVPTFDDWQSVRNCLASLNNQSLAPDMFEIILANNNHRPDLPDDLNVPDNCRVIWVEKPGSYAARNAAIEVARAEILFFTDSDCVPDPRWIENGLAALAALPTPTRIAGAITLTPAGEHWTTAEAYDRIFQLRQSHYADRGTSATANLITQTSAFDRAGFFDESRLSGGDIEWGHRATKVGIPIEYSDKARVSHPARRTLSAHIRKVRRVAGGRFTARKNRALARYVLRLEYLLPSPKNLMTIWRQSDLPIWQRLAVWAMHYRLRLAFLAESFRLAYLGKDPERS